MPGSTVSAGRPLHLVPWQLKAYAEAGVKLLPLHNFHDGQCTCNRRGCPHPAKHPRNLDGLTGATTDPAIILYWISMWGPNINWGGVPPGGVIVLDIDPRNGGTDTLKALTDKYGPLPETLSMRTGGGGWHCWYLYAGKPRGSLGEGLDIKSSSGYVVMPPSVHASGRAYEMYRNVEATPAPEWMRKLLNPPVYIRPKGGQPKGSIDPLVKHLNDATAEKDRNRRLYWAACRAHDDNLDVAPLVEVALRLGLDQSEIDKTIESARTAPPHKTRGARSPQKGFNA